jgi:hypothetical protein
MSVRLDAIGSARLRSISGRADQRRFGCQPSSARALAVLQQRPESSSPGMWTASKPPLSRAQRGEYRGGQVGGGQRRGRGAVRPGRPTAEWITAAAPSRASSGAAEADVIWLALGRFGEGRWSGG